MRFELAITTFSELAAVSFLNGLTSASTALKLRLLKAVVSNQGSASTVQGFRQKFIFYFAYLIKCCFCIRQLNYCTGVPRATRIFSWGFAPAKRLKTTGLENSGSAAKILLTRENDSALGLPLSSGAEQRNTST